MHRFDRTHLTPEVARRNLDAAYVGEKSSSAEVIALIALVDHRRDYLEAGYSCMRNYCMGHMQMTKDEAYRRIQVAKVARLCPEVFECLADGRLSVTTASVLAPHLTPETAPGLLAAAAFRSRSEIVQLVAERSRVPAMAPIMSIGESVVESCSTSLAPVQVNSLADLAAPPAGESDVETTSCQHAPAHVENPRRGRVTPSTAGGAEVQLAITDAEYEDLRAAQALLGHAVPSGDPAEIYARAIKLLRAHLEKRRLGVKPGAAVPAGPGRGRGIPKALVRLVWERDGGRCAFVSADGHRCEETARLEIDHVTPVARGGQATSDNLRLLCRAHNQYEAERVLGKEHVQRRRELAQRERARNRAAADAAVARAEAQDVAAVQTGVARAEARDAAAAQTGVARAEAREETAEEAGVTQSEARDKAAAPAGVGSVDAVAARAQAPDRIPAGTAAAQPPVRDAAHQARYDDIYSALRHLGSTAAEARWGAERADAMPDASLAECLKVVLGELARPALLRGERLARCTA